MYLDKQASANSVDPDEMLQNAASHQGLNCLSLIQIFLDTTSGGKLYLYKFYNKYGKVLKCPNTYCKYSMPMYRLRPQQKC